MRHSRQSVSAIGIVLALVVLLAAPTSLNDLIMSASTPSTAAPGKLNSRASAEMVQSGQSDRPRILVLVCHGLAAAQAVVTVLQLMLFALANEMLGEIVVARKRSVL
jgi:hypothetical protein